MQGPPALVVTGASGLVGRALGARRDLVGLSRRQPSPDAPYWEPQAGRVHGLDDRVVGAVVHLAGESVAGGRWTAEKKRRIRESRIQGTRTIVDWMTARQQRPEVLVSASAVGLYGDGGDTEITESSPSGTGFLADVCREWEAEADRAAAAGIRVVKLRIGIVLAEDGGALEKMLTPFKFGLGGPMGSGQQWLPWVHLEDVVRIVEWALTTQSARGAYNVVSPGLVRQKAFARTLGRVLGRPTVLPAPGFALKAVLGEFAEEGLLAGQRAVPRKLLDEGFEFRFPSLEAALRDVT